MSKNVKEELDFKAHLGVLYHVILCQFILERLSFLRAQHCKVNVRLASLCQILPNFDQMLEGLDSAYFSQLSYAGVD